MPRRGHRIIDEAILEYTYSGDLSALVAAVKKSCQKITLQIKSEQVDERRFKIEAAERTNWLSTNWPVRFNISAEAVGSDFVLTVQSGSSRWSITQSANNRAKAEELMSLIKDYAPVS